MKATIFLACVIFASSVTIISCDDVKNSTSEATTTVPETTTRAVVTRRPIDPEERRRRHQQRVEIRQLGKNYERAFYRLSESTYDRMMSVADMCDKELGMDTPQVKSCVARRMLPRNRRHKHQHHNNKKSRGRKDDDFTTQPTTITTARLPSVVVVASDGSGSPTTHHPSGNLVDHNQQPTKTWRRIFIKERHTVRCFVDMKRVELKKKLSHQEWLVERDRHILENIRRKANCMMSKLSLE